jgi:hypothetical protein
LVEPELKCFALGGPRFKKRKTLKPAVITVKKTFKCSFCTQNNHTELPRKKKHFKIFGSLPGFSVMSEKFYVVFV